jgi:ubiquinone/menaquinone biosynthesis C-methylase UbiE
MAVYGQSHRSDPRILGRRTLERDHRYLMELLHPGLSVLDIGCGTGAITSGIAKMVGPQGLVVGLDRDAGLLEIARREHGHSPNLQFELGDAISLSFKVQFDIVTSARTLQWIGEVSQAVLQMRKAAKPSGVLVILDYNHVANRWEPDPPVEFQKFYRAFLAWRDAHGWDNEMADHLPGLFESVGLLGVESHIQDEVAARGDIQFSVQSGLWSEVIENVGEQLVNDGYLQKSQLREASICYSSWAQAELMRQTLNMRTVVGRVPS